MKNELYHLVLSITYDYKRAEKLANKALKNCLDESKLNLFRQVLKKLGKFSVKKRKSVKNDFLSKIKKSLKIFDKKVFVLRYEFDFKIDEISFILNTSTEKVKKSLLNSTLKVADALESIDNEMR